MSTMQGAPVDIATLLDYATRLDIRSQVDSSPMAEVNAALKHLEEGKAPHRAPGLAA